MKSIQKDSISRAVKIKNKNVEKMALTAEKLENRDFTFQDCIYEKNDCWPMVLLFLNIWKPCKSYLKTFLIVGKTSRKNGVQSGGIWEP